MEVNVRHIRETGRPKASLGQNKAEGDSETEEQRAARFFTLHGMKKVGHLLGDELTKDQEKAVVQDQAAATAELHAKTPLRLAKTDPVEPSADDIEEEED